MTARSERTSSPMRRLSRFTNDALALSTDGPPWHRGVVAVVNVTTALLVGRAVGAWLLAAMFALLLTLSDTEGALPRRLQSLAWSVPAVALGAALGLALAPWPAVFALVFLVLAMGAGVAAWMGTPYTQAGRYAVVGMLVLASHAPPMTTVFATLAAVTALAALTRTVESVVVPDVREGEFATLAEGRARVRVAGARCARFVVAYGALAAIGWLGGRAVDASHPTWIAVSALMVMWPDRRRTHERAVQRVFGTVTGALLGTLVLHMVQRAEAVAALALALTFFVPHFVRRNYWLHSGLIAVFVILASATTATRPTAVAWARVVDVLIGCALAGLGTRIAFPRTEQHDAAT